MATKVKTEAKASVRLSGADKAKGIPRKLLDLRAEIDTELFQHGDIVRHQLDNVLSAINALADALNTAEALVRPKE